MINPEEFMDNLNEMLQVSKKIENIDFKTVDINDLVLFNYAMKNFNKSMKDVTKVAKTIIVKDSLKKIMEDD